MKQEDHNAVPDSVLTKEFLSQFKTEDDVSKFLSEFLYIRFPFDL